MGDQFLVYLHRLDDDPIADFDIGFEERAVLARS